MKSKKEIRLIFKAKREELGHEGRDRLSSKITQQALLFLSDKADLRHIHIFLPIEKLHEVNTFPLIKILQEQGKNIYTSVTDLLHNEMKTLLLGPGQQTGVDNFGIPVPLVQEEGLNSLIQVVFLPLLAYDLNGHRIGYGKGMYDRFVFQLPPKVVKIGLSFFPPESTLPFERHDVPLDFCIHPEGLEIFIR